MAAEQEKYPRREPTTAFRSVADEGCLVVVPKRTSVEVLNPVGGKIYSMLDGTHTEDDIVHAVMGEFEVSEEQARNDFRAFLTELQENGMLVQAAGNGGASKESAGE